MNSTMASIAMPQKTMTCSVEFLFNDSGSYVKRSELSPTRGLPLEYVKDFAVSDLIGLGDLEETEAEEICDLLLYEIEEHEALLAKKEFPDGSSLTISVEIPEKAPTKSKK